MTAARRPPEHTRLLQHLARRQRLLLDRLSRAEELADSIACDLTLLEETLPGGVAAGRADDSRSSRSQARQVLRRTADSGVSSIDIKRRPDGSVVVRIDGGKEFTLPPTLGDLLAILSRDEGPSGDQFVGWRKMADVALLLEKKSDRRFTRHAVTQHIHRLRNELFQRGGVNPFVVQTNRKLGARVALKRPAGAAEQAFLEDRA